MSRDDYQYFEKQLDESLKYGFIHNVKHQNNSYSPKILINNPDTGEFVLNDIQTELKKCQSFSINVAFVTTAGIGMLKTQLSDFADRGGTGRILVSPYLGFNDPAALFELLKLRNVEVRMTSEDINMHAKVYMFNHINEQTVVVGSSNLTHSAMKLNYEWNVKLTSTDNGDFIQRTQSDFNHLWDTSTNLTEEKIEEYSERRERMEMKAVITEPVTSPTAEYPVIVPNKMQEAAVKSIAKIRDSGEQRALVISATGTGKTYLGAFDVKQYKPEKMLFIVHREQILRDAEASFQEVIGFKDEESCIYRSGMDLSGKKYVFATIQSLSRENNLSKLNENLFDYILIDEVHHAAAASYQKIMNHFEPDFYLGLTATPERTDGQNIFELFNYNVAYEIRLQEALAEDMLSPFLYYGVTEMRQKDGELIDEKTDFSDLIDEDRVDHIMSKIRYYEVSSEKTRGLIFCSRNTEAEWLSNQLNTRGLRTVALSGKNSQEEREDVVKRLEDGELDYILTVDIFNEGIDIPSLNQIIMLRNTESSIVFVQQLGRGLRKFPKKNFVTIIDFIGNYKNNYLIPIALYGDNSLNKDTYRQQMGQYHQINGVTTINFEEIARDNIFKSITNTKLSSMSNLKEIYLELKNRLGRVPMLYDFYRNESIDPVVFFDGRFKHYGEVAHKFDQEGEEFHLSDTNHIAMIQMMSYELLDGKRPHELLLLKLLLTRNDAITKGDYIDYLAQHGAEYSEKILQSVERVLTLEFFVSRAKEKYKNPLIVMKQGMYHLEETFKNALYEKGFRELVVDTIKTGLARSKRYPKGYFVKGLDVGEKYSRKDALRLLLWENDETSTVYGYRTKYQTTPIFITYHKSDEISMTTQYEDTFINEHLLHWYTRPNLNLKSKEVLEIIKADERKNDLHLFVKREDNEGTDFYYLGEVKYNHGTAKNHIIGEVGNEEPVVTMDFTLQTPMSYDLYHYLVKDD